MTNPIIYLFIASIFVSAILGFLNLNLLRGILGVSPFLEPPYLSYPILSSIWKATSISSSTLILPKVLFERLLFLWPVFGFLLLPFWEQKDKQFYKKYIIYTSIGLVLSILFILHLILNEFQSSVLLNNIISFYSIPALLFYYILFFQFLIFLYHLIFHSSFATPFLPSINSTVTIFQNSYGKLFVFVYVFGMGVDALPINEIDLYSMKFGEDIAWMILTIRNLFLDSLFFTLMLSYPFFILKNPSIGLKDSFKQVKELFQKNRILILKLILFYYLSLFILTYTLSNLLNSSDSLSYLIRLILKFTFLVVFSRKMYLIIEPNALHQNPRSSS